MELIAWTAFSRPAFSVNAKGSVVEINVDG